ncbi:hypothetical protein C7212DRAFT_314519, partial [Tuber magnatum]
MLILQITTPTSIEPSIISTKVLRIRHSTQTTLAEITIPPIPTSKRISPIRSTTVTITLHPKTTTLSPGKEPQSQSIPSDPTSSFYSNIDTSSQIHSLPGTSTISDLHTTTGTTIQVPTTHPHITTFGL